jgi:DNA-3-methyladenine glycosylase
MDRTALMRAGEAFFAQGAEALARGLLGAIMVRRIGQTVRRARIVETEAYLGPRDLASHASKGKTRRTMVMFGPPGRAYVYFIYGMHQMFNIICGREGDAEAVLLRAAEPLDGWDADLTGPGKLARAFSITPQDNGKDLTSGDISFEIDADYCPRVWRGKRIGVDYAAHWKERLLRFVDVRNPMSLRLKGVPRRR